MLLAIAGVLAFAPLTDAGCSPHQCPDLVKGEIMDRASVGGARVELWREDGGGSGSDVLAIRTGAGHWWYSGLWFDRQHARRIRERLTTGALGDGTPAVVVELITTGADREQQVLVCALGGAPRCARVDVDPCPRAGCGAVRLAEDALVVGDERYEVEPSATP